ncbi:hypothetical protein ACS0TY_017789 [Phlomoides rotata]
MMKLPTKRESVYVTPQANTKPTSGSVFDTGCCMFNNEWNEPVRKHIVDVFTTENINNLNGQSLSIEKIKFLDKAKAADLLIFPLCDGHHWSGIAIDFSKKSTTLLVSLICLTRVDKFLANLIKVLKAKHPKANDAFDIKELFVASPPQQENG